MGKAFTDPALHSALAEVGRRVTIYSNAPRPLAANIGRRVTPLPQRLFAGRAAGSAQYQTEVRRVKDQVENGQAQVVFFNNEENRLKMISEKDFTQMVRASARASGYEWTIYSTRAP